MIQLMIVFAVAIMAVNFQAMIVAKNRDKWCSHSISMRQTQRQTQWIGDYRGARIVECIHNCEWNSHGSPFFFKIQLWCIIMANPQKENGYIAFANDLWDAIVRIRIPGEARQCFDFIARKTYGWNKPVDSISLSQFVEGTGIIKSHVCRVIKQLKEMNMITITQKGNSITIYGIQKDFEKWKPLPKKVTLPKKVMAVTQKGNDSVKPNSHGNDAICGVLTENDKKNNVTQKGTHKTTRYKPTSTKPSSMKKKSKEYSLQVKFLVDQYFKTLNEKQQQRFEKKRDEFHDHCDKLMRLDKFTEEEIRKAVNWARNDWFWCGNFLSFSKLRKKNKDGVPYIEVFLEKAKKQRDQKQNQIPPGNPRKMTKEEMREYYKVKK